jgi:hypothetical protein
MYVPINLYSALECPVLSMVRPVFAKAHSSFRACPGLGNEIQQLVGRAVVDHEYSLYLI